MSIIVTGGAGFIGSCIIRALNDLGYDDIIIVDNIASTSKWLNIRNKTYIEYVNKKDFLEKLPKYEGITNIIHLGACSSTTETDFDYLYNNNFEYTKTLWNFCKERHISFIYASSAATYGDGSNGFDDKHDILSLMPLNGYGYSKQLFDLWVQKQTEFPTQHVGLKFFNVYGPNEYFKQSMASMFFHGFNQIQSVGKIKLFKSYDPKFENGGQLRDFIYVKDICKIINFLIENPSISGLFNVGTGTARNFSELATSIFMALKLKPNIEYIEMPETLKSKYQYYTKAEMHSLREAGYRDEFYSIEDGANDYVNNYLLEEFKTF